MQDGLGGHDGYTVSAVCGIAGFLDVPGRRSSADLAEIATRMASSLRHRGPDDGDAWIDAGVQVALGHRRLAVIDLSEHGHQPMGSASGRWVLVYNGEIYNFRTLHRELEARG